MFYCHRKSFDYLTLIRKKVSACEIAKIKWLMLQIYEKSLN